MAKIARCEQCGKEAALQVFGSAPAFWFEVTEHRPGSEPDRKVELCSPLCVGQWGAELAGARLEAEQQRTRLEAVIDDPSRGEDARVSVKEIKH